MSNRKVEKSALVADDLRLWMEEHGCRSVIQLSLLLGANEARCHRMLAGQAPIPVYIYLALQALSARIGGAKMWEPPAA